MTMPGYALLLLAALALIAPHLPEAAGYSAAVAMAIAAAVVGWGE